MKYFIKFGLAAMLAACSAPEDASIVGADLTDQGCIPSAGYQWSKALDECVRLWEVGTELIHQGSGDPDFSAWAIHTEDKAEVIIAHDNRHVLLMRQRDSGEGHVWINHGTDMILIIDNKGILQLKDAAGFVMYAQDNANAESGYDEIPDHSSDEVGGEIIWAKGVVKSVEDGAYPQFTLHIDLENQASTTVFNLIAEGARLNGADLGALDGKTVEIEYVVKQDYNLMVIDEKGSSRIENTSPQDGWYFTEGLLEGADEISGGDLPDTLVIWENGGAVNFEAFIDPYLVKLNGKDVSAWFEIRVVNDMSYLKLVE